MTMQPVSTQTEQKGHGDSDHGMMTLTREMEQHHLAPMPGAADPLPRSFPPAVMRGLHLSIIGGALVGLLVGFLLFNSILVIPGWEALFSMGPFTFYTFWVLVGIAAGVMLGGVGTLLLTSSEPQNKP